MPGVITDLVDRVSDSSTGRPIIATLAAPGKTIGAASINLVAATNWTTSSAIHFSMYETTVVGSTVVKDASTQTDWKGTLSGVAVGNLTLTGGTDRAYTAGAIVELTPTSRYAKDLYDWAMTGHNQNGTHKTFTESSIIPTAAIQDSAITVAKVADASLTRAKLNAAAGELAGAWESYTPTLAGFTLGNGTMRAKYYRIGKFYTVKVAVTSGTTSATTNPIVITNPVASIAYIPTEPLGIGKYKTFHGPVVCNDANTVTLRWYTVTGSGITESTITSTSPDVLGGAGQTWFATWTYEAA